LCKIDAVILASGLSKRMGGNKLLLPLGNSTVISQFLSRFPYTLFQRVIFIFSDQQVGGAAAQFPILLCYNATPEAGKSQSIQLGLAASTAKDGIMFAVADQPLLKSTTIHKLVTAFKMNKTSIVLPEVDGKPGNPVIFPSECRAELCQLQGDDGGRQVIKKYPKRVRSIPFPSADEFVDIDTPGMYQKVTALWDNDIRLEGFQTKPDPGH
jgi:molybdenum cofactor cytidylyltransferase